jgi:superfamily I DNA and/or RNA helicase
MEKQTSVRFKDFLSTAFAGGTYTTDDIIAFVIPLFKQVSDLHIAGLVAPFGNDDALLVTSGRPAFDVTLAHSPSISSYRSNIVLYLPGYRSSEQLAGLHDDRTDLFCLGLILAGMAMGLDLYDPEQLGHFVDRRVNPLGSYPRLHPVLARLITGMTELDRSRRTGDLSEVIRILVHYRDDDPQDPIDPSRIAGWVHQELKEKGDRILSRLRNRLFDISRRNRLLYYKPNKRFVNLTLGSVPLVLHDQSIRPELLFTWHPEIAGKISGCNEIVLNKYLRFEDHPYLAGALDGARLEAQRDLQEYGFSQLRLVIAFLDWHNLREEPDVRIQSPLLLVQVSLRKQKKVKEDQYVLKILDNAAEVNPVLAGQLRELYGIRLPDRIELDEMDPERFYTLLKAQVEDTRQGIMLRYIGEPSVRLLDEQARQIAGNYRAAVPQTSELPRQPVGLELFRQHLDPEPGFSEMLIAGTPAKRSAGNVMESGETAPSIRPAASRYDWDFNVCNMVVGNFNYKKMSLVRDYNLVLEQQLRHPSFEALFDDQPRSFPEHVFDGNRPEDWYHVVTADPTQTRAILRSRAGYSYIIQGPPGTGKSQTITNLIADFVARGKSILFICEKRAALDVVYHRLKQVGLEELCCYIHDSQGDKREFIRNLKTTYEDFIENKMDLTALKTKRESLIHTMNRHLALIREFHEICVAEEANTGIPVRELLERIILLRNELVSLRPEDEELLPAYPDWIAAAPVVMELETLLDESGRAGPVGDQTPARLTAGIPFSKHPFSQVQEQLFSAGSPYRVLTAALEDALKALDEVEGLLSGCDLDPVYRERSERAKNAIQFAVLLQPLARAGQLALADPEAAESKEMDRQFRIYHRQQESYRQAVEQNSNWKEKLPERDLDAALALTMRCERSFWGGFNASWRKLKRRLQESYDLSAHSVRPSYQSLLEMLKTEYVAAAEVERIREELVERYPLGGSIDTIRLGIELLQGKKGHPDLEYLLRHPKSGALITSLQAIHQPLNRLEGLLMRCLQEPPADPGGIRETLLSIRTHAEQLPDWLSALRSFAGLPEEVRGALRHLPLRRKQVEAAIARKGLQELYRTHRSFMNMDGETLEKTVTELGESYPALLQVNAALIRAFVRQRFLHQLDLSNRSSGQLTDEQKKFKKTYIEGRKILENEFGKSMRYKSIRELSEKESGQVLKAIKPVWLMSPYSVSDSLPLDPGHFDVVIFDEASQITLEEGVPALYRSQQTIIVGDEKQMPPTDFFTANASDGDPDDLDKPGAGNEEGWSDDANSLLAQGAKKLESALLSWHYRSHYETLISFSNHAFYEGELLTIPDKTIHHREKAPIRAASPGEAAGYADHLFDRSISYHLMTGSVYEKRSNRAEATYIAQLVRELLRRGVPESIGIVAFSQEQQQSIAAALQGLATEDALFAQQLEEAFNRTDNDMFTGLIIKNLENIQGDERDIMLISVCYGPDSRGRMLMNFGPVNKKGGEKRLNVLFSRARKHMAVVSSIRYDQITNEYNEGANYLRRFLHYAELISEGRMDMARTILDSLVQHKTEIAGTPTVIRAQLKEHLEGMGYTVAGPVGQSDFKCSLAVKRRSEDEEYALAILIDDEGHYRNGNLIEQYYQRPAILESFGWRVLPVYAKDWLHQPQKVLEHIVELLKTTQEPR